MYIVHVHVRVQPEFVEDFRRATLENARKSIQEPGVARFDLLQQQDDATCFTLVEVYRTADDPALHKKTLHYKAWSEAVADMMAEPRSRVIYSNVFPEDPGWG